MFSRLFIICSSLYFCFCSLENAGEVSVLPLLRSVRLNIQLLASLIKDPSDSFCGGISIEVCSMVQLF